MFGYRRGPYIDADGWSILGDLAADAVAIYVSKSTGNNANTGFSPAQAKETAAAGMTLLNLQTQDRPHRLCFKAEDEWPIADTNMAALSRNGRSTKELLLLTSYDGDGNVPALTGARPLLNIANNVSAGFRCSGGLFSSGGGYVGIVGLELRAPQRDPGNGLFEDTDSFLPNGIDWLNPCRFILVEDCKISFMANNMIVQSNSACVWFRRNIIHNAWSGPTHGQGSFTNTCSFTLMQENFYYHNGWNDTATFGDAAGDGFNHNFYVGAGNTMQMADFNWAAKTCGRAELIGNISSRGCAGAMQHRPGGRFADNLLIHNAISGFCAGKPSVMEYNVALHGVARPSAGDGWGLELLNGADNSIMRKNIVAHHEGTAASFALKVRGVSSTADGLWPPIDGAQVLHNIVYDWDGTGFTDNGTNTTSTNNQVDQVGYSDPGRTLYSYDTSIGGPGTEAHFIAQCLARPARTWTAALSANAVNNYIRAGFDMPAYTPKLRFNTLPYDE